MMLTCLMGTDVPHLVKLNLVGLVVLFLLLFAPKLVGMELSLALKNVMTRT